MVSLFWVIATNAECKIGLNYWNSEKTLQKTYSLFLLETTVEPGQKCHRQNVCTSSARCTPLSRLQAAFWTQCWCGTKCTSIKMVFICSTVSLPVRIMQWTAAKAEHFSMQTLSEARMRKEAMTCSAVSVSAVSLVMKSMKDWKVTVPCPLGSTRVIMRANSASPWVKVAKKHLFQQYTIFYSAIPLLLLTDMQVPYYLKT